jgi:hypothetical protein
LSIHKKAMKNGYESSDDSLGKQVATFYDTFYHMPKITREATSEKFFEEMKKSRPIAAELLVQIFGDRAHKTAIYFPDDITETRCATILSFIHDSFEEDTVSRAVKALESHIDPSEL